MLRRSPGLVLTFCVLAFGLFGCGGKEPVTEPGPVGGSSQTDEERAATLEQVFNLVSARIPDALKPPAGVNATIVTALQAMPEFAEVQELPGGVWARFKDDEELFIMNDRFMNERPDESDGPDSAAYLDSPASDYRFDITPKPSSPGRPFVRSLTVPSSKKARLINTMGSAFQNVIPTIRPWLQGAGYDVNVQVDASIEGLKDITGDGVVYLSAHGLPGPNHIALWTTTPYDSTHVRLYRPQVKAGLLAYGIGSTDRRPPDIPGGYSPAILEKRIVITEKFVEKYWRPAPGALVYVDACYSNDARLRNICLGNMVKASAYLGWTERTLDDMAAGSARFFFDRTLGANSFGPFRNPPQRPFDGASVLSAMASVKRKNGLPFDLSLKAIAYGVGIPDPAEARLILSLGNGDTSPVLRPGISFSRIAEISSNGGLELQGTFGDTPGTVTMNGQPLAVKSGGWQSSVIRCNRPAESGAGATGDVVVTVNGHASNPRRITGWDVTCMVHWQQFGSPCESCQWDATWRGLLRADADQVRGGPELSAHASVQSSSATTAQDLTMEAASGAYSIRLDTTYDVTWSLSTAANTPVIGVCLGYLPTERYKGLCFQLDGTAHQIILQPTWVTTGITALYVPTGGDGGTYAGSLPTATNFAGNFAGNGGVANLDGSYTLHSGENPVGPLQTVLRWQSAAALSPPDPRTPK